MELLFGILEGGKQSGGNNEEQKCPISRADVM